MPTDSPIIVLEVATDAQPHHLARQYRVVADYWALTKPEVSFLIAITVFASFCLCSRSQSQSFQFVPLIHTLVGTLLVASGAGTLNQFVERHFDARMRRTARRPLATGRLEPGRVLRFGVLLSLVGGIYLALAVNVLASALSVLTLLSYLFVYTPLKRKTPLCTLVGAFSGAMPPLIGWTGASGKLGSGVWILYITLFLWQFPHFMAIAWMYREDYARAGYRILSPADSAGRLMGFQAVVPALALILFSVTPVLIGHPGSAYFSGTILLGMGFLFFAVQLAVHRSNASARKLLSASIIYLPLILILIVAFKA